MRESKRRQRPPAGRSEPDRSTVRANRGSKSVRTNGSRESKGTEPRPKVDARDAGYRAINDAYRLIDEYLRQGQRMAENLWLPLGGLENDERSQFKAPERFMRAMSDMTMAWVELMQQWTTNVQPATPDGAAGEAPPFTAGRPPPPKAEGPVKAPSGDAQPGRSLKVVVESRGRVEVSVHVGDLGKLAVLVPTELRPFAGDAPPITDVKMEVLTPGEAPILRISVPEAQPAGAYNGLLVERVSGRPRGTVSLLVQS